MECRICGRPGEEVRIYLVRLVDPPVDWSREFPMIDGYSESIPATLCDRPGCRAKLMEIQRERGMVEPLEKYRDGQTTL